MLEMPTLRKLQSYLQLQLLRLLGKAYFNLQKRTTCRVDPPIQPALQLHAAGATARGYLPSEIIEGKYRWHPFIVDFNSPDGRHNMIFYALNMDHAIMLVTELKQMPALVRKVLVDLP